MADLFYCSCLLFSNISDCAIAGFFDLLHGGDLFSLIFLIARLRDFLICSMAAISFSLLSLRDIKIRARSDLFSLIFLIARLRGFLICSMAAISFSLLSLCDIKIRARSDLFSSFSLCTLSLQTYRLQVSLRIFAPVFHPFFQSFPQ